MVSRTEPRPASVHPDLVAERFDPKVGRAILKYLSDDYLLNDKMTAADGLLFSSQVLDFRYATDGRA